MNVCKKCGYLLDDSVTVCTNCGNPVNQKIEVNTSSVTFCKNCGCLLDDSVTVCTNCGNPVNQKIENNTSSITFCKNCGYLLNNDVVICTNCGKPVNQRIENTPPVNSMFSEDDNTVIVGNSSGDDLNYGNQQTHAAPPVYPQQPPVQNYDDSYQNNNSEQLLTFEKFFEACASQDTRNSLKRLSIVAIIATAISVFLLFGGNTFSLIDIAFYGIFAYMIRKKINKNYPLIITCYSGAFTLIAFLAGGIPIGIVVFIFSLLTTLKMKKLDDAYKIYLATKQLPPTQI